VPSFLYNQAMQPIPLSARLLTLSFTFWLLLGSAASAQTAASGSAASTSPQTPQAVVSDPANREPRIERIHLEDAGSVIDELRVGGETKSIDVKPKGGMPAYQVAPGSGERSWKVLGF